MHHIYVLCLNFLLLKTCNQNGLKIVDLEVGRKEKRWWKRWVNEGPREKRVQCFWRLRGKHFLKNDEVGNRVMCSRKLRNHEVWGKAMGFMTDDEKVIGENIFSQVAGTETRFCAVNIC